MKLVLIFITFCCFYSSFASSEGWLVNIEDGRFNPSTNSIELDVQYGGGCKEHIFKLKMGTCRESYPVQCDAQLIDLVTDDFCDAIVMKTVSINLHDAGLDDGYYDGALLEIHSAGNSNVLITLSNWYQLSLIVLKRFFFKFS